MQKIEVIILGKTAALLHCLLLALLAVVAINAQGLPEPPAPTTRDVSGSIIINTEMVSLTVGITDAAGRFFGGLRQEAFAVYENGIKQEIGFFSATDSPASVGIVFDFSSSMTGTRIERARMALARFVKTSHPDDEYLLVGFNDQAQLLLGRTQDDELLLRRAGSLIPRGQTALYDAIALGVEQVQQGRYVKRALIVISDGEDNQSRLSFKQLRRLTHESGVTIYSIVISDFFSLRKAAGSGIGQLAEASGGSVHYPTDAEQMSEAFEGIALELRQQYSLGYVPTDFVADGKWRRLQVKITPPTVAPKFKVRHRMGYYAFADQVKRERSVIMLSDN